MTSESLKTFLETHHHDAWHWARQCCRFDKDLANEVLQVSYLKVLEGKAVWSEKSTFKTWIFSVIRFTALDLLAQGRPFVPFEGEGESSTPDTEVDYIPVINTLAPRQAEVLLLVFYHNLTLEEAAEALQIGIGSVRKHYDRGKKRLKELLKHESYEL
jgi:RNA polymerase sigma-70 factor (ECF subfamily)